MSGLKVCIFKEFPGIVVRRAFVEVITIALPQCMCQQNAYNLRIFSWTIRRFFWCPKKQMNLSLFLAPLWEQGEYIDAADRPPDIPRENSFWFTGPRWAWMNWRRSWWRVRSPGPNCFHRDLTPPGPPNGGFTMGNPLFYGNLGWWNVFIWPDSMEGLCHEETWLILPVVICLSQRLSHACLSISSQMVKLRMAH